MWVVSVSVPSVRGRLRVGVMLLIGVAVSVYVVVEDLLVETEWSLSFGEESDAESAMTGLG